MTLPSLQSITLQMIEQISYAKNYVGVAVDNLLQVGYSKPNTEAELILIFHQEMLLGGAVYHNINNTGNVNNGSSGGFTPLTMGLIS